MREKKTKRKEIRMFNQKSVNFLICPEKVNES